MKTLKRMAEALESMVQLVGRIVRINEERIEMMKKSEVHFDRLRISVEEMIDIGKRIHGDGAEEPNLNAVVSAFSELKKERYQEGFYYLQTPGEEAVLVYGYNCDDVNGGDFVFGYNMADGGAILPLSNLRGDTLITSVIIYPKDVFTKDHFMRTKKILSPDMD